MKIDKELLDELLAKAASSERLRTNFDLRTSPEDGGQRMLNALLPGTVVAVHRHPMSNESVLCLKGRLVEVLYEEAREGGADGRRLVESERVVLDPSAGTYGCVVPAGAWHTVEVLEPSVIFEAKDGKYGEDGSDRWG